MAAAGNEESDDYGSSCSSATTLDSRRSWISDVSSLGSSSTVDWWTLGGVFMYEMMHGRTPFKGETNEKTLVNILKQPLSFPSDLGAANGKELEEMLRAHDLVSLVKKLSLDPKLTILR